MTLLLDACNKLARLEFERVGALRDMKRAMAARRNALHKIIVHVSLPPWPSLHGTPTSTICTIVHTLLFCPCIMISGLQGGANPSSAQSLKLREMLVGHSQEAEERVFASVASSHSGAGAADGEEEEDDAHTKLLRSASHPTRRYQAIGVMVKRLPGFAACKHRLLRPCMAHSRACDRMKASADENSLLAANMKKPREVLNMFCGLLSWRPTPADFWHAAADDALLAHLAGVVNDEITDPCSREPRDRPHNKPLNTLTATQQARCADADDSLLAKLASAKKQEAATPRSKELMAGSGASVSMPGTAKGSSAPNW